MNRLAVVPKYVSGPHLMVLLLWTHLQVKVRIYLWTLACSTLIDSDFLTGPPFGIRRLGKVDNSEGEDIKISFNSKYMMDALRAIQPEEVTVEFFGTMRPFTITPSDSTEVVQLILPIRTY